MRAILVFFDTLNRRFLPPYGNDWIHAPNFKRLAERTVIFDNCYAGSLPCMPARREHHTGRYNFLHRSWGPIEPFDDSMPEILKKEGVYTHLVSDHYHYWEDGGCTYHPRYNTWEIERGHEGDPWKGNVKDPEIPEHIETYKIYWPLWRQDWVNRKYMQREEDQPQAKTFKKGLEFIETNYLEDNWFLQIETFDPHEPFFTQQKYKDLYKHDYDGPHFDWPDYSAVRETPEQVQHCRLEYAASISMCDNYLGKILDIMDEKNMWKDTMLIVTTDHGFLLGEKNWWGKMLQPIYNEIALMPLFIWDPRSGKKNERRNALVQTIDFAPTILEFFGVKRPKDMQGKVLKETVNSDVKIREVAIFGIHGAAVNITDGRYVYMRGPANPLNIPLYDYTLMPTHMRGLFPIDDLKTTELAEPFTFTKGCKTMKIEAKNFTGTPYIYGTLLFDLQNDPNQENPITDPEVEKRMIKLLVAEMKKNDAPVEQFERLGIPIEGEILNKHLKSMEKYADSKDKIGNTEIIWTKKGKSMYYLFLSFTPNGLRKNLNTGFEKAINAKNLKEIDEDFVLEVFGKFIPENLKPFMGMITDLVKRKAK
jgi:arylsulfatase A-like enzyme/chorismate mutase